MSRLAPLLTLRLPLISAALVLGGAAAQMSAPAASPPVVQAPAQTAPLPPGFLPRGPVQQAPALQSPDDYGRDLAPHRGQMEWWYVSSSLPEAGLALHWALFKVEVLGRTLLVSHVAVTDLSKGTVRFTETIKQDGASVAFPPLRLTQEGSSLVQTPDGFSLKTPDLDLTLRPLKPAVRHPASGTPDTGQLEYQSVTRMALSGQVAGRAVAGQGWFDHQWGDQLPGQKAFWDWMGLQLSDGSELMLYRVRDAAGTVLQTYGTRVAPDGQPTALSGLTMKPVRDWTSALNHTYALDWDLTADGLNLQVRAPHNEQELVSRTTGVTYWEGPMLATGTAGGQPVTASGMGEFLSPSVNPVPLPKD